MSVKGRKQFLEVLAGNQAVIRYVKLFRMPLFLSMLDEELKEYDDAVWEKESTVRETALRVMPLTLQQYGVPQEETDGVIDACVAEFLKK